MTDGTAVSYEYDSEGIRLSKTVDGNQHKYIVSGNKILRETVTGTDNYVLDYLYDGKETVTGFIYNNSYYYFQKNIQGDVLRINNVLGAVVVEYKYDAWGNVTSITGSLANTVGKYNPIRYRSYYYDTETGLYYLNSRYYDPEVGRFISADVYISTGQGLMGNNMFAYCGNNPVMRADSTGELWELIVLGALIVGSVFLSGCTINSEPPPESEVPELDIKPYSSYGGGTGNVYIVTEDKVSAVNNSKNDNDVIIVDHRTNPDPNMQLLQSYKVNKKSHQQEIAGIMIDYNSKNPVSPEWNRTVNSLVDEWRFHNFAYSIGYKRERTADTDFNNKDEGKGFWDYVWR